MSRFVRIVHALLALALVFPTVALGYSTGPATVIDDVEGAGFSYSGPRDWDSDSNSAYNGMNILWQHDQYGGWGYGGYRHWSYIQRPGSGYANYYLNGEWRPNLPRSADYQVYAWIPWNTTTHADYNIHAANGTHVAVTRQYGNYGLLFPRNEWVYLGTFPFNAGTDGSVTLDNWSPESNWNLYDYLVYYGNRWNARCQVWDAVQFVPVNGEFAVRVFHDKDYDGTRDADEPWVPNRRVLFDGGSARNTGTDGTARYYDVPSGWHSAAVDIAEDEFSTTSARRNVWVYSSQTPVMEVGVAHYGSIRGVKYLDENGDGVRQSDETTRLGGWPFTARPQKPGLRAQFFDNFGADGSPSLPTNPVFQRIDPTVNFEWGSARPCNAVEADDFAVRWEGMITAEKSGTYWFMPGTDDGVRLWVDGKLIDDRWYDRGYSEDTVSIGLEGGKSYSIKMEMYENGGAAAATLKWKPPQATSFSIVPPTVLSPEIQTLSTEQGSFAFDRLIPGETYVIEEGTPTAEIWAGWRRTKPASGSYTVPVSEGMNSGGHAAAALLEFMNAGGGNNISGMKFEDRNDNGVYEGPGESDGVVAGWEISLRELDGSLVRFNASGQPLENPTVSSADGTYLFKNVKPGVYLVAEEDREGWHHSTPAVVTADIAKADALVNFGNVKGTPIFGVKFHDRDCDGAWDRSTEETLPSWPLRLRALDGSEERSGVTPTDGTVLEFANLRPKTYEVSEEARAGWSATTVTTRDVALASGEPTTVVFGNVELGSVAGVKYEDRNADGDRDPSEPGLDAWTIRLSGTAANGEPVQKEVTTGPDGSYRFDELLPGEYRVIEVYEPGQWRATQSPHPATPIDLQPGEAETGLDFGNVRLGSISGVKFDDSNADGKRQPDELAAQGDWTITLEGEAVDGSHVSTSVAVAGDGTFEFRNLLEGRYVVGEREQKGWMLTTPIAARTIELTAGGASSVDVGNVRLGNLAVSQWDDGDADGATDVGEPPIAGWEFYVTGTAANGKAVAATLTADAYGRAALPDILPGTYTVREQLRDATFDAAGRETSHRWVPTTVTSTTTVLAEGDNRTVDFGNVQLGCISGRVTHEIYGSGIPGVRMVLEETGEIAVTDSQGNYRFLHVAPNGSALAPTPDYLVGMDLEGSTLKTNDAVDKSVVVSENECEHVDFTVWNPSVGNQPRTIGYWKNWENHYSASEMEGLVGLVRAASPEFAALTVADVPSVLKMTKQTPMRDKARAQYLAVQLNIAAGHLGFATWADVGSVQSWQTVITDADGDGQIQVIYLIKQVEEWFSRSMVENRVWETLKNLLDSLNNSLLTVG